MFRMKPKSFFLELLLCKHCNLKCKGCNRWSNIAEEEFYDFEDLKNDLLELKKSNIFIDVFSLIGGEPLLYPNLRELIYFLKDNFKKSSISIFTNGSLCLSLDNETLNSLKKCQLIISEYKKSSINYNKIYNFLDLYNIKHNTLYEIDKDENLKNGISYFGRFQLSKYSTQSAYSHKIKCMCDVPCLWKGYFYGCSREAFLDTLNKYFNEDFKCTHKLNVKEIKSYIQMFKFFMSPSELCKNCLSTFYNYHDDDIGWTRNNIERIDFILDDRNSDKNNL